MANSIIDIPIVYHRMIPKDHDFLFKLQSCHRLRYEGGIYIYIMDATLSFIKVKNATSYLVKLSRHSRLGTIMEYNRHGYYIVSPKAESLATYSWRDFNTILRTSFSADQGKKYLLLRYNSSNTAQPRARSYPIFKAIQVNHLSSKAFPAYTYLMSNDSIFKRYPLSGSFYLKFKDNLYRKYLL